MDDIIASAQDARVQKWQGSLRGWANLLDFSTSPLFHGEEKLIFRELIAAGAVQTRGAIAAMDCFRSISARFCASSRSDAFMRPEYLFMAALTVGRSRDANGWQASDTSSPRRSVVTLAIEIEARHFRSSAHNASLQTAFASASSLGLGDTPSPKAYILPSSYCASAFAASAARS